MSAGARSVQDEVSTVRWGIIGAGRIAKIVGEDVAAAPANAVTAVAARSLGRARELATHLGAERAYGSYHELVADPEVDVVYVTTIHPGHHAATMLALRAGKHVLVEKPIAMTAHQAREMVELAQARNLLCAEAMWLRLNPAVVRTQEVIAAGEIGQVQGLVADSSYVFPHDLDGRLFNPDLGGGILLDGGVYLAALAWLLLGRPDEVKAKGRLAETGVDAAVAMRWGYSDGRFAQLTASSVSEATSEAMIIGTEGWIQLASPLYRTEKLTIANGSGSRDETHVLPDGNGYGLQVAEVARCVRGGLQESSALPSVAALGVMEVLDEVRHQVGVRYREDQVP
jgi:predicted dehydrogenase